MSGPSFYNSARSSGALDRTRSPLPSRSEEPSVVESSIDQGKAVRRLFRQCRVASTQREKESDQGKRASPLDLIENRVVETPKTPPRTTSSVPTTSTVVKDTVAPLELTESPIRYPAMMPLGETQEQESEFVTVQSHSQYMRENGGAEGEQVRPLNLSKPRLNYHRELMAIVGPPFAQRSPRLLETEGPEEVPCFWDAERRRAPRKGRAPIVTPPEVRYQMYINSVSQAYHQQPKAWEAHLPRIKQISEELISGSRNIDQVLTLTAELLQRASEVNACTVTWYSRTMTMDTRYLYGLIPDQNRVSAIAAARSRLRVAALARGNLAQFQAGCQGITLGSQTASAPPFDQ